jgi:hypothetical protein
MSSFPTQRPRNETPSQLARVGLLPLGESFFECKICGTRWTYWVRRGGLRPRGWWKCPNGCNH